VLNTTSPVDEPVEPIEKPRNFVPSASTNVAGNLCKKKILEVMVSLDEANGWFLAARCVYYKALKNFLQFKLHQISVL